MSHVSRRLPVGAEVQPQGGTHFRVWAPDPRRVSLRLRSGTGWCDVPLEEEANGYWSGLVPKAGAGAEYRFRLDDDDCADPASRFQPEGPFGPSQVVDPSSFRWSDASWQGVMLPGQVIYEMHIGTFTAEGTYAGAIGRLPQLAEAGITVLELMPVAEFPGRFGWGYDGVFPYAPTRLYGSPDDLRAFVDRAHALGLAVILDVVYNHLGPDGCVFSKYAKSYFTKKYDNEWGEALNFDEPGAAPVREYFAGNGGYWVDEFHLDGLRLDATQSIHDDSREHIIAVLGQQARTRAGDRSIIIVTENEPQDVRMLRPLAEDGYGLDGAWNDDFHHSAIVAMAGRAEAYYTDHRGTPQEFVSAAKHGYLFQGQRYAWQKQNRGTPTRRIPPAAFVNFIENHDQLANSGDGSRMHRRTTPGRYRAMTALTLLMPGTPMLFQGQEFGATTPFLYFADHKAELAAAVQRGRAEFVTQFASFASPEAQARLPVPHDESTFRRCKLDWTECDPASPYSRLHRDLLALRRRDPAFRQQQSGAVDGAVLGPEAFALRYITESPHEERLLLVNLGADIVTPSFAEPLVAPPAGFDGWGVRWSSEHPDYGGLGTPGISTSDGWRIPGHSAIVLQPTERTDGSNGSDGR
jgi:maltooligosyltrehalose trehalohydrolase